MREGPRVIADAGRNVDRTHLGLETKAVVTTWRLGGT